MAKDATTQDPAVATANDVAIVATETVETTTANFKELNASQALEIVMISSETPYSKGKRAEQGKSFNTYTYNGVAFIVESSLPFVEDQRKGLLHSVKFKTGTRERIIVDETGVETTVEVDTLEFLSSVSTTQMFNARANATRLAMLDNLAKAPMNESMMSFLLQGA